MAEEIRSLNGYTFKDEVARAQNAQLSEEIGNLSTYVTPEMFGAVGDGVADDTEAIQAAINSGKEVRLSNKYICNDIVLPSHCKIVLTGHVRLNGTIAVTKPFCTITGSGSIYCVSEKAFVLYGANENGLQCRYFHISGISIQGNDTNTCFLITDTNGGNVFFVTINANISSFKYGIKSESVTGNGWFTALTTNGIISMCDVAIGLYWGGDGSLIENQIQPRVDKPKTLSEPLITISNNTKFSGMIWDENTANNAIILRSAGEHNIIDTCVKQSAMEIAYPATTDMCNYTLSCRFPTKNTQSDKTFAPYKTIFTQANNILYGKGVHNVIVTPSTNQNTIINLVSGTADRASLSGNITIEYDFGEYVALRELHVLGDAMPDKISMYYKGESNTYSLLKSCTRGEDYESLNGGVSAAFWGFKYNDVPGYGFNVFARGVKFEIESVSSYTLLGLYAMVARPNFLSRYGDDVIANTLKLKGADGKLYTIAVNNGEIVVS